MRALASSDDAKSARGLFTAPSEQDVDWGKYICNGFRTNLGVGWELNTICLPRSHSLDSFYCYNHANRFTEGQAHRILMPAFGPMAIEGMFDGNNISIRLLAGELTHVEMHDIASQLILKWARQGHDHKIPVTSDFSRLTLDTIALCAMDFRFNSFYQDELHPFIKAMNNTLLNRSNQNQLFGMLKSLLPSYNEQLKKDAELQVETSKQLVQYRRENPTEKKDLLNAMIYGKDPKTGQTMREDLIAANMQTFLIAGMKISSIGGKLLTLSRSRNYQRIAVFRVSGDAEESGRILRGSRRS